ncbi:PMGT2-like protein [Mya arenaria]|uniref:PMGT2-like protein n=1 Tax=Mya arenaria TaxID=6604 RepID=A0ABY7EPL4_MYAAR|nr:protein O-linked-mannose beta-1,4-N-acetylglucosaminyltransferase 2-like [Mya arenaria]XP_052817264.1 protein O-linked-mannose beta-1,4-N-acetylglucosaminyltransferase 2-like [Mya arenaria]WAR11790.1 PMGT2-like protein [Mya arenaria]
MTSLHMLGHMVSMAIIATLVKQIVQLNLQVDTLKEEVEVLQEKKKCGDGQPPGGEGVGDGEQTSTGSRDGDKGDCVNKSSDENHSKRTVQREDTKKTDFSSLTRKIFSSVKCYEEENRVCHFQNLCYSSLDDDFVMFHDHLSTLENVQLKDGSVEVSLVSVPDHNAKQISVTSLPSHMLGRFSVSLVNDTTLMFQRFLPDNLMHMFHDDLLPLHNTLKLIEPGHSEITPFDVSLFIYEHKQEYSENDQFYSSFSSKALNFKSDFANSGLTCFRSIFVGLSTTTLWYDYGFTKPQGPIENMNVQGGHIKSTVSYLDQQLSLSSRRYVQSDYVVLLSRKENRKILNEVDLSLAIVRDCGLNVVTLDLDHYSLTDMINYVQYSRGVIGMHGSLLILSMFLKPYSFVIELFPYAVTPDNYTPYKTLAGIRSMNLIYKAWINADVRKSRSHPDWPSEIGGLSHLEESQREIIKQQTTVPSHLCCTDPSWLFHIYQDTEIDVQHVVTLVDEALDQGKQLTDNDTEPSESVHPSKVKNVSCNIVCDLGNYSSNKINQCSINIRWAKPWTVKNVIYTSLQYEVIIQDMSRDENDAIQTVVTDGENLTQLMEGVDPNDDVQLYVWVRAYLNNGQYGPHSDALLCS